MIDGTSALQLEQLWTVLEGGKQIAADNIIQFPVDAAGAAAETALSGEGITTAVELGNGVASEVSQLTVLEGGASTATTSGLGILAMDVGVAGAAIAPALGILAGVGLYNLAPEFWTNVSNSLMEAGQLVGGKIRAFANNATKQIGLSAETIEIFKNAFIEAGLFNVEREYPIEYEDIFRTYTHIASTSHPIINTNSWNSVLSTIENSGYVLGNNLDNLIYLVNGSLCELASIDKVVNLCDNTICGQALKQYVLNNYSDRSIIAASFSITDPTSPYYFRRTLLIAFSQNYPVALQRYINSSSNFILLLSGQHVYMLNAGLNTVPTTIQEAYDTIRPAVYTQYSERWDNSKFFIVEGSDVNDNLQPDATYPDTDPFPQTYPNWQPWEAPEGVPFPSNLPDIYPIEIPAVNPNPDQEEAQNPDSDPDPAPLLDWLLTVLPVPTPNPDPDPEPTPTPEPDPDPQPEPEPISDPIEDPVDPDPINPNPDPVPGPLPIVPALPSTVDSNAMFTVYKPTISQLNQFGSWLWSTNIIEQILRMWQNPLDGIIAFMKVYANPTTEVSRNIQVGYLDSNISAPVVAEQFNEVDLGSVEINELYFNATDYTPYVNIHLYLPFIGIVELDPNDFMNGEISIRYKIDVYTGTCLAEVKCTRDSDMPNATIIYTFSGNASQQLPLTSSNFNGAFSALVSAVSGGIAIASGGSIGSIAGSMGIGHSLMHEMVHINRSGSMSANAGIMGSRKPYIIITRRKGYDANGYNQLYGYPTNKTVFLGNCTGFTRVKAGRLQTKATEEEKKEIMSLLKQGVIL